MSEMSSARWMSGLSAAVLLVALVLFGFIAGGLVATRVIGTSEMGWDEIADTLGGLMVGGALSVAAWLVALRLLGSAGRLWMTGAAVVGSIGASIYLLSTPPLARSGRAADIPAPAVAPFTWQMGVADGLAGPPEDGEKLPWTFLRIASNLSLDYVPAGRPDRHCVVSGGMDTPEAIGALNELRAILLVMSPELSCGEPCPRCMEVSLQWFVDNDRATTAITDRCWRSHEVLQPLRTSVERLFATYGGTAECSASTP
jgi:hypothetical protein